MAIVKIKNPFTDKIEQVKIAGEDPTQEELNAFVNFSQQEFSGGLRGDFNFATATPDEIRDYARLMRQKGIDPVTRKPLTPEQLKDADLKDPGVDYETGVKDFGLRYKLGNLELQSEKEEYLKDKVGEDGFRLDKGGRFILTNKGREALNLGEGKELAIDEEGASRYDIADFAGTGGLSLATGIGAGILMSGTGFLVAALLQRQDMVF